MFDNLMNFFKKFNKKEEKVIANSKDAAKERLHLVLMQDRANVSADFLELMKQEIIEVIKKYIDVDENAIDVRLTNKENSDGTNGAPALYANIPILNIKNEARKTEKEESTKQEEIRESKKEENKEKVQKEIKKEEKESKEKNIKEDVEIIIDDGADNKKDEAKEKKEELTAQADDKKSEKSKEEVKSEN